MVFPSDPNKSMDRIISDFDLFKRKQFKDFRNDLERLNSVISSLRNNQPIKRKFFIFRRKSDNIKPEEVDGYKASTMNTYYHSMNTILSLLQRMDEVATLNDKTEPKYKLSPDRRSIFKQMVREIEEIFNSLRIDMDTIPENISMKEVKKELEPTITKISGLLKKLKK